MLIYERLITWYRCTFVNAIRDKQAFEDAIAANDEGRFSDVLVALDPVLRRNPGNVFALPGRSFAFRNLNEMDAAWQDVSLAIELAPAYVDVLLNRGELGLLMQRFEQARIDFEKVIRLRPRNGEYHYRVARCWHGLLEFTTAIQECQRAIDLGYKTEGCWEEKGSCHLEMMEWEAAWRCFNEAIQINTDDLLSIRGRGTASAFLENYQAALVDFHRYLDREPDDVFALNNRCFCYLKLRSWSSAMQDLDRIFVIDSEFAPAWKNLAILQSQSSDWSFRDPIRAVESATKAMELSEWKATKWLPVLADAYESAGDHAQAAVYRQRASGG